MFFLWVSVSEHQQFQSGEQSDDDALEPVPPEQGQDTPVVEECDADDEQVAQ